MKLRSSTLLDVRKALAVLISVWATLGMAVHAALPDTDLRAYYGYPAQWVNGVLTIPGRTSSRPVAELTTQVALTGGGLEPWYPLYDPITRQYSPFYVGRPYAIGALMGYRFDNAYETIQITSYREGLCHNFGALAAPTAPTAGSTITIASNVWFWSNEANGLRTGNIFQGSCGVFAVAGGEFFLRHMRTDDELNFGAPLRRTAIDGSQYDASPMQLKRNGLPWYTHYFGYHLGLVANESNWDNANLIRAGDMVGFFTFPSPANNFNLAALPPPWVEDDVVEYVNRAQFPNQPGGQFFYTALPHEKALLDSVPTWQRTGSTFKSGGYVSACRFYGGKNGGPNTHFFSADDKECAMLKQVSFLEYEGQSFAVNMPMPAKTVEQNAYGALKDCPIDSQPLYRLYNNASSSGGRFVSNHRYVTERTAVDAAVAQGWRDEGHVMCVPI